MKKLKALWNKPITVGGYVTMCIIGVLLGTIVTVINIIKLKKEFRLYNSETDDADEKVDKFAI